VVETLDEPDDQGRYARLTVDLQEDFALNQPLSTFALAAFEVLDPSSPTYALDILSVIEATLDDPRQILAAQLNKARGEAVQEMKAEGIKYEERMELLQDVDYPKPIEEELEAAYDIYRAGHPWVGDHPLRPKSVARDMYERAMTFTEYIAFYELARAEGLVLRYLSGAYRALQQTVPDSIKNDDLIDLIEWLGELVRQVDSSLLDEWEQLANPQDEGDLKEALEERVTRVTANTRAFRVLVRNALFRRVELAALERYRDLGELDPDFGEDAWRESMAAYWDEYDDLFTGPDARGPRLLQIEEVPEDAQRSAPMATPHRPPWRVRQVFDDPEGHHDWGLSAEVDLTGSDEAGEAVIKVVSVDRL
jgi:hypothetical protein